MLTALMLVPVIFGLIAVGLLAAGLFLLLSWPFVAPALVLPGCFGLWLLWRARRAFTAARPARLMGAELASAEHPRVWLLLDELTIALDVPPVERVVVDGGSTIAVSSMGQQHELLIGLPLLVGLDRDELGALLAHELAHEAGNDPARLRVYRLGDRLETALGMARGPARVALLGYTRTYRTLAGPTNRRHELAADDHAAQVCGPDRLASAIQRIDTIRLAWQVLLEEYLPLSARAGRRPALAEGVRSILAMRGVTLAALALQQPGPTKMFDAHPRSSARLDRLPVHALGVSWGPRVSAGASMLGGGERAIPGLERLILVDDDEEADWIQIVERAGLLDAQAAAGRLARAALSAGLSAPITLSSLLQAIEEGQGPAIAAPLLAPAISAIDRPSELTAVLHEALGEFITLVQLRSRLARHVVQWNGRPALERRSPSGSWLPWDADRLNGDRLVAQAAASPAGVKPLREWLRGLGADVDRPIEPAPPPLPRALSALSDVDLCGPYDAKRVDLVLYSTGMLLAPAPPYRPWRRLAHWLRPVATPAAERFERTLRRPALEAQRLPGSRWIDCDQVAFGQLQDRRSGLEIQLRLLDGDAVTIRATAQTSEHGAPMEDLRMLLPLLTEKVDSAS